MSAAGIDLATVEIKLALYQLNRGARELRYSEGKAGAELGGEGDADGGAGAKEIA